MDRKKYILICSAHVYWDREKENEREWERPNERERESKINR